MYFIAQNALSIVWKIKKHEYMFKKNQFNTFWEIKHKRKASFHLWQWQQVHFHKYYTNEVYQ